MRDPAAETLPWEAQAARRRRGLSGADRLSLRAVGRSTATSCAAAGFADAASVGGLEAIAALPLTEKDELRASRTAERPIGAHLAAPMARGGADYSTSGTTGAPSYIPLTRGRSRDLDRRSPARSYAASGVRGRASGWSRPMARGRSWRGRRSTPSLRSGSATSRWARGTPSGCWRRSQALAPDAVALTPSYALHLAETAAARGIDLARLERRRGSSSPASRGAARRSCARGWRRPGGRGSPRRWGSATSRCRSGASARRGRGCTSPGAASSTWS